MDNVKYTMPSEMERYLFDLNGYLVLKNALSPTELEACNKSFDRYNAVQGSQAINGVHVQETNRQEGVSIQQLYEGGQVWQDLIDHPNWFNKVVHFLGTDDPENFDGHHGPAFIDESFGSIREKGGALRLHSGGHVGTIRTQYRFHAGKFHCGQVNILMALSDIGPGDGATMVIPGSHKSNIRHPQTVKLEDRASQTSADETVGAIEVHLKAGDALLFVDAIMHGSARRTNDGERRIAVYRYGPSWGYFRHHYRPSEALLRRLTPIQARIVMPHSNRLD